MKTLPNMSNLSAVKTPKSTNIATTNNFVKKASSTLEMASTKSLVVVDSRVENYEQLIGGIKAATEVFVLNATKDAIEQITEILGQRSSINSLHIVSHGREAAVEIGRAELNIDNLETYSSQLQEWGKAFSASGNILLYGCNVAAGESGIKFIQKLSELTGANIAASHSLTGSAALGGDWELEIATGRINAELAFKKEVLEAYTSVLATLVTETFQGSTALGPWIYNSDGSPPPGLTAGTGPGIIPGVVAVGPPVDSAGSGALRLTSNAENQANYVIYNSPISSTDGLKVTFDLFAYNGSIGADGVSFFLIDGTTTPTAAGGFGGSLGYAPNNTRTQPGIAGGYLGVGLDEFGNFSTSNEGREGGTGQLSDSIAIRGSAATTYSFLTNATVPGGIDNVSATTRTTANIKKTVQITLLPGSNRLSVALDNNGNGVFDTNETLIDIPNLVTINGAIPATFKFGFASSTGSFTNTHEIANLTVETILTPVTQADISVAKTGPAFATPGSNITYTITSTNIGPALGPDSTGTVTIVSNTAADVLIQDQLPANLTFVSADNGGTYNPTTRTVIWPTIPTLLNGASATRTITATVPAAAIDTTITNTAFSNSSTYDPNRGNNNGSLLISQAPTTIVATTADLVTTKTGTAAATAGSTVSYTISTVNNGPSPATNVIVTDSIIPGLTGVVVSNGGTYNTTTGIVTFQPVASLASGAASAIANTVSFIAPASGPSVSNTASSSSATPDPTPGNNNATVTTALTPSADLVTTKTGTTAALPGATVSYTISTVNNGPSSATNVIVTDSIIPGLTGVVVSNGGTYNTTTGIVTFQPVASLASGAASAIANTVSFIAPASGPSVSNTASSSSATPDPTPGNNNATVTTALTPSADLVTTKTGTTAALPGATVSYTISTVNNGPSSATNVIVTDSIIPGLTGVVVSNGGTYNTTTGIVSFPPVASLASGATLPNTISFPAPLSGGSVSNTASSSSATPDPTPGNNNGSAPGATVTTALTPTPTADVVTTKTGTTAALPGATVSYTISTVNNGPSSATNVTVTDSIIPGLTGVVVSNGGTYNTTTGIVSFPPVASLASGATLPNTISFPAPLSGGSVSNTASSSSATPDPTPGNNNGSAPGATVTTTLTPTPTADVVTTKTGSTSALPGATVSYTISTVNNGPSPAANVIVTDSIIPGLTGVVISNGGTYNTTTGIVSFPAVVSLANAATVANTVSFIAPLTGTSVIDKASSSSTTPDPTPGNNNGTAATATVTTTLTPTTTPAPNQPPVANNANFSIPPNSSTRVPGLGGSDPDGSIASYAITTLPPANQGILYLGDPANGGVAVTPGQVLTPAQLGQLYFQATGSFTGANFNYSATDNSGATSLATATVAAIAPTPNLPPVATNVNFSTLPNSSTLVTGLGGSDPDGSIASYTINTLPPATQGLLFLGDPANGGVAVTPGQVLTPEQLGQLFFQATGDFTGANFNYSATDNGGVTSPATATVAAIPLPVPVPTPTQGERI